MNKIKQIGGYLIYDVKYTVQFFPITWSVALDFPNYSGK
jgi:hypothetical protein